jgi:hypothetical protein
MRFASLSVLLLSTVTLTACGGAGGDIASLDPGNGLCGTSCPTVAVTPPGTPTTPTNSGGQPLPPVDTVNGGNTTRLTSGNAAITLENAVLTSTKDKKALVDITFDKKNIATRNDDEAVFKITTTDGRNAGWPVPKKMLWQQTAQLLTPTRLGANSYDEYKSTDQINGAAVSEQLQIWNYNESYIGQYRESAPEESPHQAWVFGGANKTALANMPTAAGTVTKTGQWTGTAKTVGYKEPGQLTNLNVLQMNNWWGVRGTSEVNVDFNNKTVDATLTATHFKSQADYTSDNPVIIAGQEITVDLAVARTNAASLDNANYFAFMDEQIKLSGTIVSGTAASGTTAASGNQIANGTVSFSNPTPGMNGLSFYSSSDSVANFQGGFYGANAEEFVGSFAGTGTITEGSGGVTAITTNGTATYSVSGVLHAQ